ncbi:fimbrial protein [Erwinia typographi]|uniref:fimbrial protein n=1 Tax=Erwinia typographi TaxID=371042 RepID=UPI0018DDB500|nr:fimbrial protein [Erwinia typographi]
MKCANENIESVINIGINTPRIVVTKSTPIGTVIHRQTVSFTARCSLKSIAGSPENVFFKREDLRTLLGNGLSLYITYRGDRGNTVKSIDTKITVTNRNAFWGLPSSHWQQIPLEVEFEIVKEQHAGDIVVAPASLTIFTIDSQMRGGDRAPFFMKGANKIDYRTQTCEILSPQPFIISLGTVSSAGSSGFGTATGTTSATKDFSLNLACDVAASGTFKIMIQLDGTLVSGFENTGVLALNKKSISASGAGIQVLHGGTETPVSFATPWQIGKFPMVKSAISIPFSVRYYQTEHNVRPGEANGTMTYTISYL